jgi:type IV pilus assembly protein PilB
MARKKIGEILIEEGVLDETRLRAALVEQQRWGGPLGRLLVDMKLLDEHTLVEALSRQLHIPAVDIDGTEIPRQVIDLVPGELAEQHSVIPFAQPMKFLDIAMVDPTNLGICDELQIRTRLNVRPHLAGPKAIERAIARYYGRGIAFNYRRNSASTSPPNKPIEMSRDPGGAPMEIVRGLEAGGVSATAGLPSNPGRDAEISALQQRVSRLEALMARDENVLRKVLSLLVEKGVATREEIVERLK